VSTLPDAAALQAVLAGGPRRRRRRRWLLAAGVVLALAVGAVAASRSFRAEAPSWRTEAARVEDLHVRVTAVGSVAPREVVAVGSEQSGLVHDVLVDENDQVVAGQPLAILDTELLDLQRREQVAQVATLAAQLAQSRVVADTRAVDLARVESLDRARAVAPADLELARSASRQADAAVTAAEAQLRAARARLALSGANLDNTVIRSPISGVVLARRVDPGQLVVAALQAVTLFEVAADLAQVVVEVDVDEADVTRVRAGQRATFTVSAWGERAFSAVVAKVHLAADTTAGVVTYRAELLADNVDGALRPGMTATARIESETWPEAVTVPLSALRFAPPDVPDDLAVPGPGQGRLWRLVDGAPSPVVVDLGPTDGTRQAVTGLPAGSEVVTGRTEAAR
jgi:HlyD family secretion protein